MGYRILLIKRRKYFDSLFVFLFYEEMIAVFYVFIPSSMGFSYQSFLNFSRSVQGRTRMFSSLHEVYTRVAPLSFLNFSRGAKGWRPCEEKCSGLRNLHQGKTLTAKLVTPREVESSLLAS